MITVIVATLVIFGVIYAIWGGGPSNPEDIPTIKAEGTYKQKPDDPGGIDIPHQDVRIYDQLDAKGPGVPKVEHLLPPPEAPKDLPQSPTVDAEAPAPAAAPADSVVTTTAPKKAEAVPNPPMAAEEKPKTDVANAETPPKAAADPPPTAAKKIEAKNPAPKAEPKPEKAEPLTIDKILQNVSAPKAGGASSGERAAVQLASVPNEAEAKTVMAKLQQKYASELGSAKLHLTRADLGSKGIYYRIQSDLLTKSEANRICSSLKKVNAGCFLVGK